MRVVRAFTSCLKTSLASSKSVISESWGLPSRERTVSSDYKALIFNKIAAWEGASHGFETLFSREAKLPFWLVLRQLLPACKSCTACDSG